MKRWIASPVLVLACLMLVSLASLPGQLQPVTVYAACAHVDQGTGNTATGTCATASGGNSNAASGAYSTVGGGFTNRATADYATIAGGGRGDPTDSNTGNHATDDYTTIGGGANNQAGNGNASTSDARFATVAGGENNSASGFVATISGGNKNIALTAYSSIGGGFNNSTQGYGSGVGGGYWNTASGDRSVISGGSTNTTSGAFAAVGGGGGNLASADNATIAGGLSNKASADNSAIGGGYSNQATGLYATVPGGYFNVATGNTSFAAGRQAKAKHQGTFVWGDYQAADIASTATNQFIVRAGGGIWLGTTSSPSIPAGRFIQTSTGAYLSSGGAWTNSSDKNLKTNVASIDPQAILQKVATMPVAEWNYKAEDASVKHIGPMAQDFAAAFGLGEDNTHIATVDADGVALAAIQGLKQEVDAKDARIAALEQKVTSLQVPSRQMHIDLSLSWSVVVLVLGLVLAGLALVWIRTNRCMTAQ